MYKLPQSINQSIYHNMRWALLKTASWPYMLYCATPNKAEDKIIALLDQNARNCIQKSSCTPEHAYMVHDTENLTFCEEFRGCSARTPADSCVEQRGSSAERPQIFCAGGHKFFADSGWKWQKPEGELRAQQQCKDRERHRKDSSNSHCRIRLPFPVERACRIRVRFERVLSRNPCKY